MTVCNGKKRDGGLCTQPAGWGTNHVGSGHCKLHGGASTGRPITHGRYSVKHRSSLEEKVQQFLHDPAPGDLNAELALIRALLQDYLNRFVEGQPMSVKEIQPVLDMVERIGTMVERIARIMMATALTQAELQVLQAIFADLVIRYIDDPVKREQFILDFQAAIPAS